MTDEPCPDPRCWCKERDLTDLSRPAFRWSPALPVFVAADLAAELAQAGAS